MYPNLPCYQPTFDGVLNHGGIIDIGGGWSQLIAPDGSGNVITITPAGVVSYSSPSNNTPYTQFIIQPSGAVACIMPDRSGGPQKNARWWNYVIALVPTSGL